MFKDDTGYVTNLSPIVVKLHEKGEHYSSILNYRRFIGYILYARHCVGYGYVLVT